MPRKRIGVTVISLLLICLSGCSCPNIALHDELLHIAAPDHTGHLESVGVYLDTTSSMKGFLTNPDGPDGTVYSRCLHELGKLIAGKYTQNQVTYYRVDTPLWKVKETEKFFEKARSVNYYQQSEYMGEDYTKIGEGQGYDSLCITIALEEGQKQDLFILITDFYENSIGNDTNAATLISKIRELAYQDDGKIFGLIGIKSTFAGKIYDTGMNGRTVSYGLEEGHMSYRPFYIILRGYPEYVTAFCDYMKKEHLDALDLRSDEDYQVSIFYEESFLGLDYTAFLNCVNRDSRSLIRADLSSSVTVKDSGGNIASIEIPIYEYHKKAAFYNSLEDRTLYFSYTVDDKHQCEFRDLIEEYGHKVTVDFLAAEKELYEIICRSQEMSAARLDENGVFSSGEGDALYHEKDYFVVDAVYYDPDSETVYIALHLTDQEFTEGVWRLQWKNTLDKPEPPKSWWEDWHSASGSKVDYSKTERLTEYVGPIFEKMLLTEHCILSGVVYLNIMEG